MPLLAQHFLDVFARKLGKNITRIPLEVMKKLESYGWPGNVRELAHVIERAVILSDGHTIKFSGFNETSVQDNLSGGSAFMSMEEMERQYIERALTATRWRVSGPNGAAKLLGLTRSVLRHRMQKLGIMATPAAHKREKLTHTGQENESED